MKEKEYHIAIKVGKRVVYTWVGVARDDNEAREFAYDQFEMDSVAEVENTFVAIRR